MKQYEPDVVCDCGNKHVVAQRRATTKGDVMVRNCFTCGQQWNESLEHERVVLKQEATGRQIFTRAFLITLVIGSIYLWWLK